MVRLCAVLLIVIPACSTAPPSPADREALERAFEESMRGAVLNGHFTVRRHDESGSGTEQQEQQENVNLRSERYEVEKVVKRAGDIWTFHARIQFSSTDVTVPVPVRLTWSGDTPMVSVTDLGIPGMGTYTARVVFYRDSYAGMWWGGSHGGNLFGRIEKSD